MNRASIVALVLGAMLFGCGVGMVAHEAMVPNVEAKEIWSGDSWEYKVVRTYGIWRKSQLEEKLGTSGIYGWQLVHMDDHWLIMKRPLDLDE